MLAFILIIAISTLSIISVMPAGAQSIPTPSAPQFSVQYISYTYNIAPTYTINPYTGQNETTTPGYQTINETIVFTIKNQPFTPYTDSNGNYIGLYYNFRYKGNYGDQWNYYPFYLFTNSVTNQSQIQTTHSYGPYSGGPFVYYSASSSEYTIISITLNALTIGGYEGIPNNSLVDFQTQAQIGHIADISSDLLAGDFYNFTGESSDWSNTQTLTINYNQNSTSSNQTTLPTSTQIPTSTQTSSNSTATPQNPTTGVQTKTGTDFNWTQIALFAAIAVIVVLAVSVIALLRRQPRMGYNEVTN